MPIDIGNLWEQVLSITQAQIDKRTWTQTLGTKTLPISLVNDSLTLGVTNSYVKFFIEANDMVINPLREAVHQVTGNKNIAINIIILGETSSTAPSGESTALSQGDSASAAVGTAAKRSVSNATGAGMGANSANVGMSASVSGAGASSATNSAAYKSYDDDRDIPPYEEFVGKGNQELGQGPNAAAEAYLEKANESSSAAAVPEEVISLNSYQAQARQDPEEFIPEGMMKPIVTAPVYIDVKKNDRDPYAGDMYLKPEGGEEKKPARPEQTVLDMDYNDVNIVINPDYNFENFVVGNSNRMAYSAAMYVADHPAENYNPYFLYGNSGLGKTHLMHAIANRIRERRPDLKILCMTSENFLNAFVDYVRTGRGKAFRSRYRTVDILMVDDIQFIQDKHYMGTQNEFFHTFNALLEDHKQIILTSDTLPKDLDQMTDRLKSRFQSGFLGIIEPPDMELRIAILRDMLSKVEQDQQRKIPISNEILTFVASCFQKNVRELQGAFKSIVERAISENFHRNIDIPFVKEILSYHISQLPTNIITIDSIQDMVCKHYGIKLEQLKGKKKTKDIAFPRQVAMYLARELTDVSYVQIGASFGKDHSTIMHAYERIAKQIEQDEGTATAIKDLIAKIRG